MRGAGQGRGGVGASELPQESLGADEPAEQQGRRGVGELAFVHYQMLEKAVPQVLESEPQAGRLVQGDDVEGMSRIYTSEGRPLGGRRHRIRFRPRKVQVNGVEPEGETTHHNLPHEDHVSFVDTFREGTGTHGRRDGQGGKSLELRVGPGAIVIVHHGGAGVVVPNEEAWADVPGEKLRDREQADARGPSSRER